MYKEKKDFLAECLQIENQVIALTNALHRLSGKTTHLGTFLRRLQYFSREMAIFAARSMHKVAYSFFVLRVQNCTHNHYNIQFNEEKPHSLAPVRRSLLFRGVQLGSGSDGQGR